MCVSKMQTKANLLEQRSYLFSGPDHRVTYIEVVIELLTTVIRRGTGAKLLSGRQETRQNGRVVE